MGTQNQPKCGLKEILTIVHFFIFLAYLMIIIVLQLLQHCLLKKQVKNDEMPFYKFGYSIMIPRSAETRISGSLTILLPSSVLFRYFFLEKFLLFIVGKSLEPFRRLLTQLIGVKQIGKTKDWKSRRNRKSFLSRWHGGATMWILLLHTQNSNTYNDTKYKY